MTEHRQLQSLRETLREHAKNFEDSDVYLDAVEEALTQVQRFDPAQPSAVGNRFNGARSGVRKTESTSRSGR